MATIRLSRTATFTWQMLLSVLASKEKNLTQRIQHWLKWLTPGLQVKRWLVMSAFGVLLATFGATTWLQLTSIPTLLNFPLIEAVSQKRVNSVFGMLALAIGFFLYLQGQAQAIRSITEVMGSSGQASLVDLLKADRHLKRGPKIVAIGGGTGLSTLLRGLKHYSTNLTAVVTVADDGGSSGRLRRDMGVLPPGDIRNCLGALADEEGLLTELFQYRFQGEDQLSGHSFGNLFLTAMSTMLGDFERAVSASSKVLAVRGRVLPASLNTMHLWARFTDGRYVEGESNIGKSKGKISEVGCFPANPKALPEVIRAIQEAEVIIIGPGSLYTSIIPNLLVPESRDAIANAKVPRIYVCNIMTQPGETEGFTVADHLRALDKVCGMRLFDAVFVHQSANPGSVSLQYVQDRSPATVKSLLHYAKENSQPVVLDQREVMELGCKVVVADVLDRTQTSNYVRHHSMLLADALIHWYRSSS